MICRESRSMRVRSSRLLLAALVTLHLPATAANIEVSGSCTLIDAIDAANNDDDAGGLCPPGGSGADVLELTGDIELVAIHNTTVGANGLPVVVSDITIAGNGFEVSRAPAAPEFRFFRVEVGAALVLESVTLSGGVGTGGVYGGSGGAIYSDFGSLELFDATLRGNSAEFGGAIWAESTSIDLVSSTVSGNYAAEYGGGIGTYGSYIEAVNSTLSSNSAGYLGGAIWGGYGSTIKLVNSTVASNSAAVGGGISDYGSFSIPIDAYGTVFGYNLGGDCGTYFVDDGGGNFDSDGSCVVSGALSGLDPTLADHGGPTQTHALLAGSSAIDAAGACGLAEDQRGSARDVLCDSGSFEFGAAPVGGSAIGTRVQRVVCRNVTTGQAVTIAQPEGAWDCEAAGLAVSPGDRVRQEVSGRPGALDVGGTAIAMSQLRGRCENRTSGQQIQFIPAGTLSWSCLDEGLSYLPSERILQVIQGVAD